MEKESVVRLDYLDAMRGLAALGVVFCHLACVFWDGLYYEEKAVTLFERIWCESPLNAISNGNLPVQFFFVLSGLLIARNLYIRKPKDGLRSLGRKYTNLLKLTVPAIILPFLLMRLGLMFHLRAFELDPSLCFVEYYNTFTPTFKSLLIDLGKTFFMNSDYNGPLWTIHFELIGSLLITMITFYIHATVEGFWKKKLAYLLFYLPLGFLNLNYCAFVAGALAYDLYFDLYEGDPTDFSTRLRSRLTPSIRLMLLVVALYFATINLNATGVWSPFHFLSRFASQLRVWGICLGLLLLLSSRRLQRIFSEKLLVGLGKLSRYIYIFHWPVILSLGCFVYCRLYRSVNQALLLSVVIAVSLAGTLLLSYGYACLEVTFGKKLIKRSDKLRHAKEKAKGGML